MITEEDVIESVADALQYVSYYHPPDFIRALHAAYEREQSTAARDAIAQMLIKRVPDVRFTEVSSVEDLGSTARATGGFGSTGRQ